MPNFQIVINQISNGQTVKNVTNWQLPDNLSATLQSFADSLRASYATHVLADLSTLWSLNSITVRQMDGGPPFSQEISFTSGTLPGGNGNHLLPQDKALLVTTTFLGPKPNRGRVYIGGYTEFANGSGGAPSSAAITQAEALIDDWRVGILAGGSNAFLRIARPDFLLNTWTLNNPVEGVIGRIFWKDQNRRRKE